ncbi:hypothetical protein ACFX2I_010285 [Malus domestica]
MLGAAAAEVVVQETRVNVLPVVHQNTTVQPRQHSETDFPFPVFLGKVTESAETEVVGSNVTYDDSMNSPYIVWLAPFPSNSTKAWAAPGVLVALDALTDGIIYRYLITEYVNTQGLHAKMILGKLQLMSTTWMCRMRNQRSRFSFADALFKHYTISFPWSSSSSFHRDSASEACKKLFWYNFRE